jgi:uncharacterized BrkB/YihY/UPF0761 family membrane protein
VTAPRLSALPRQVVRGLFEHHAFDHAATMAFYFFLGTIPLLVVAGLFLGKLAAHGGAGTLAAPLYHLVPKVTADLIRHELHEIAGERGATVAPLSALGFLWLTSNGFHNLMDVFEILTGAQRRPWLRQRSIAVLWVLCTLSALIVCVWFLLETSGAIAGLDDAATLPEAMRRLRLELAEGWRRLGVVVVFVGVATLGLAAFYRVAVVHPPGVARRVWPGTLVAMALWGLVSWASPSSSAPSASTRSTTAAWRRWRSRCCGST